MGGPGGLMAAFLLNDGAANRLPWGPGAPRVIYATPPGALKKHKKKHNNLFSLFFLGPLGGARKTLKSKNSDFAKKFIVLAPIGISRDL